MEITINGEAVGDGKVRVEWPFLKAGERRLGEFHVSGHVAVRVQADADCTIAGRVCRVKPIETGFLKPSGQPYFVAVGTGPFPFTRDEWRAMVHPGQRS